MRVVFMGTPEAAVPTLSGLVEAGHEVVEVWTQPDRPSGRGKKLKAPPVKLLAEQMGLSVFQPESVRKKEIRERFAGLDADVAVVVAYGQILTKTYLNAFEHGCINVHFSLLPKYRGAAPVNWAIANGESVTGVTTMKMDRGLDTGDILLVDEIAIDPNVSSTELMERLSSVGSELLLKTLSEIDQIEPLPQDDQEASYAPLFAKSDGLINWKMEALEIKNRVRGFQPFPSSFSFLSGQKRAIFWRVDVLEREFQSDPGTVSGFEEGKPIISCGNRSILVQEAQISGKPKQIGSDFARSADLSEGMVFGKNEL